MHSPFSVPRRRSESLEFNFRTVLCSRSRGHFPLAPSRSSAMASVISSGGVFNRIASGSGIATASGPGIATASWPGIETRRGPGIATASWPGIGARRGPGIATVSGGIGGARVDTTVTRMIVLFPLQS